MPPAPGSPPSSPSLSPPSSQGAGPSPTPASARPTTAKFPMTFFACASQSGQGVSWRASPMGMRFSKRASQSEHWYS